MPKAPIATLFVDIGGVLLTDGWDHHARKRAADEFKLDFEELNLRHRTVFASYEEGKVSLDDYLSLTVFYERRACSREDFQKFMFAQTQPHLDMIDLIAQLKSRYRLKVVVVSNEARELNAHRISQFKLADFVDVFVSSCFVGMRKPDADIFRLALDVSQTPAEQVLYIENTPLFVEVALRLGIQSILHTDFVSTCGQLASFDLHGDGARS